MTVLVAVDSLSRRFGSLLAVNDISFTVARGEVLGFLGPNGSGKSTTMKMISGFLRPSAGTVNLCGVNLLAEPIAAQRRLGYLPEGAPAYAELTPAAYLRFIADARGLDAVSRRQAIAYAAERANISDVLRQPIDTLSKGYKRRVGLAQALLHDPDVLILDEPTDGLDPNQKFEVRNLIREIAPDKAIIISTHILEEVGAVCDRALIIANGRVVADGTPDKLKQRSRYHNTVSIVLARDRAGFNDISAVRAELEALAGVAAVETSEHGQADELLALAENGGHILPSVAAHARRRGWPVEQLRLRRGQLDEVFRSVTTGRAAAVTTAARRELGGVPAASGTACLKSVWAVCRRELTSYFATPVAYVFVVVFIALAGALTFFLGGFFTQGEATLESFFQFHPWLYLFLIPAVAMRLWAEERKNGSIEVLLTLPVTTASTVLGKFFAAWLVVGIGLLLTSTLWLTVNYLGAPDNGVIAVSYMGSFLMAGGYLAIGACVSALTSNQVIAFILAAAFCFLFTASGLSVVLEFFSGWAPRLVLDTVVNFSFLDHFRGVARGVIDLRDIVFFVSTIVFFLFANVVAVERRKNT